MFAGAVIGRDAELDFVEEFLDQVGGGPAALVLSGEPGIGKTILWQVGVEAPRARFEHVLTCRAVEAEVHCRLQDCLSCSASSWWRLPIRSCRRDEGRWRSHCCWPNRATVRLTSWRSRHRHKERNVCDLLPERDRPTILARIRGAWALTDPALAEERLERLACELERTWPDAGGSLREGLEDTLTLMRLGITGQLAKTLWSTNPCESMIEIVRYTQRNVKRWRDGDMRKRWTAAGMLVAEQQFRRIIGYRDLAKLVIAIERHVDRIKLTTATTVTHTQVSEAVTV